MPLLRCSVRYSPLKITGTYPAAEIALRAKIHPSPFGSKKKLKEWNQVPQLTLFGDGHSNFICSRWRPVTTCFPDNHLKNKIKGRRQLWFCRPLNSKCILFRHREYFLGAIPYFYRHSTLKINRTYPTIKIPWEQSSKIHPNDIWNSSWWRKQNRLFHKFILSR